MATVCNLQSVRFEYTYVNKNTQFYFFGNAVVFSRLIAISRLNIGGTLTIVDNRPFPNYLLQLVKNAIPCSQFLRLTCLCSDDADFNHKCEERCQFFGTNAATLTPRAVTTEKHLAQELNRPRNRTTNNTEWRNKQNSIHPRLPSTKSCSQKCNYQKPQNSPPWSRN